MVAHSTIGTNPHIPHSTLKGDQVMPAVEDRTETLNRLLRGELSAVETYQQALEKVGNDTGGTALREIGIQHYDAANRLREHILRYGGEPSESSGAWGAFASAVMGAAKLFGNQAAWEALQQGEEHGVHQYEKALDDHHLMAECRVLIETQLLPAQKRHVAALKSIQAADANRSSPATSSRSPAAGARTAGWTRSANHRGPERCR
jgi:uncharacterized protein (TIGR02284 family)